MSMLPEDAGERRMFDQAARRHGSPLKAIAGALTQMRQAAPTTGSYGKMLTIYANEVAKAQAELEALRSSQPDDWRGIEASDEVINYVARYGGMCRDCADEDGVCPNSGLPCRGSDKAIRHVINALNYGFWHGYLKQSPPLASLPEGGA